MILALASTPLRSAARGLSVALLLGLSLVAILPRAEAPVPPLTARVTDRTATLTPAQRDTLERELTDFEARKGSQIAILLVPTTAPESIEQYALRAAEAWKLGRKGVDDGVLLVIAKDDRALRIEVGYGLEGVIPDAIAKRVVAEAIVPHFKEGDFYAGIHAGVNRMMRLVDGEPLPAPSAKDPSWSRFQNALPLLFIAVFVGGGVLRTLFGRLLGAGVTGGISAWIIWLIIGSVFGALVLGLLAFFLTLAAGMRGGRSGIGGWPGGGSMGGGFGGGGFRGGGGGFGGGGASGRW